MLGTLPVIIEPFRLAAKGSTLAGTLETATMSRLLEAVHGCAERVSVELRFERDEQGVTTLRGRVTGHVELICQRCLEPMGHDIDAEVCLGAVRGESAMQALPGEYEPLVVGEEGGYPLATLVEDELLLALPIAAMHPHACVDPAGTEQEETPQAAREGPFAGLALLRRGRNGGEGTEN
ncbi:MAG: hypothetical protein D6786_07640 [Gammaproteobacteria bacterium]|nr:MAG: hypothetical protein D6786_07640 [Gammaproteobacteria bacterium]